MEKEIQIIVLVGPKGAGKSTIGRLLQKQFVCKFFEFDREHLKKYKTWDNYLKNRSEAQEYTRKLIRQTVAKNIIPVFEIVQPNDTIALLMKEFQIGFIDVHASKRTILDRVKHRNTIKEENFIASPQCVAGSLQRYQNYSKRKLKFLASINTEKFSSNEIIKLFKPVLLAR